MTDSTVPIHSATTIKFYGLDHLRTFAIVFVLLFHAGRLFPSPAWVIAISDFGWTGVDLFFVLSGYLIASQLFATISKQQKISFREFFIKRSFRIIPAYLLVVALYFCFSFVHEREALAPVWKYLTFTQNIGLNVSTQGTFSHAWSLCIEEQFYLLLPLILALLVRYQLIRYGYILLLALFIGGFVTRYLSYQQLVAPFIQEDGFIILWYQWIYYVTWCRLDGLLIGVGIAALFCFRPQVKNKLANYGNALLILSLVILAVAFMICNKPHSFSASVIGFPLVSIGYGILVIAAISEGSILYRYSSKVTSTIAMLSYGIYLVHKFVFHITQLQFTKLDIPLNSNLMFGICILATFICAIVLNRLVERPFLHLRDRILQKRTPGNRSNPSL